MVTVKWYVIIYFPGSFVHFLGVANYTSSVTDIRPWINNKLVFTFLLWIIWEQKTKSLSSG